MFKHRIQDNEQFTHTGNQGHLFSLSGFAEPFIELAYQRVAPASHQSGHIKYRSDLRSTSPGATLASSRAAIVIERRYSNQSSYLPSIQVTQFGKVNNEGCREFWYLPLEHFEEGCTFLAV